MTRSAILFDHVQAPLNAGDKVGELVVLKEDQEIGRYPLIADATVKTVGLYELYKRMFETLM